MKKKILLSILLLPLIFVMVACTKKDVGNVAGQNATMSVKSGQYSVTDDGNRLALKIKISNDSYHDDITAMSEYFVLVDKNGDKVKGKSSYEDGDLDTDNLSKGEKTQGYVYFDAKKNTKYTLKFKSYDSDLKTNIVAINTKDYKDNTAGPKKAVEAAINVILLNKKDANFDKYVANDESEMKSDFKDNINEYIKGSIFMDYIDDASVDTVAAAVQKFNADNGSVEVKVKSMTDGEAEVEVKAKTIDLDNLEEDASDLQDEKFDAALDTEDMDTDGAEEQASKEIADKISDYLKKEDIKTSESMTIKLQKEGKKWKIDTSDDEFGMISDLFKGQTY